MKTRQQAAEEYGLNKYGEYFEESVKKEVIQDFLAGCEHADKEHRDLIERAFVAGRSQTTWEQFKNDNGLPFKD